MPEAWICDDDSVARLKAAAKAYIEALSEVAAAQYGDDLKTWPEAERTAMLMQQGVNALINHFEDIDMRMRLRGIGIAYGAALAQFDAHAGLVLTGAFNRGMVAGAMMVNQAMKPAAGSC